MTEISVILKLHDLHGGHIDRLHDLLDRLSCYEIVILDTTPSVRRRERHCRIARDAKFVYTTLRDAVDIATHDYIAVLDLDELPTDLSKVNAVHRAYIHLEEEL